MENPASQTEGYTVVARRYRPRSFEELIGQDHIAQALSKAISSGRVGHAYLFTGARGVGKTSTARIFAKALNLGEPASDALVDEIASAIDAGEDMDVIEIDGASNRGIDEIRQLRSNVNVRPSRARYKIYIIDEVHMLTPQAFNALLKTLEEPPAHVKFIFCTTDPDKIPITVLSRCQRFDFAPVKFESIQLRLKEISQAEGYEAEDEALALLARRAAGSMRDSQSLLEQVMSFSTERITVEQVHALLGIADERRLMEITQALHDGDALQAIHLVDASTRAGADPGQLTEQLLNYLRDAMAAGLGAGPELLKLANPAGLAGLKELAISWGVPNILSSIQILDEALVRMRTSVSALTLLEVALVQICQLEQLASIPALLEAVMQQTSGGPQPSRGTQKKKLESVAPLADRLTSPQPTAPSSSTFSSPEADAASMAASASGVPAPSGPAASVLDTSVSDAASKPSANKATEQNAIESVAESRPWPIERMSAANTGFEPTPVTNRAPSGDSSGDSGSTLPADAAQQSGGGSIVRESQPFSAPAQPAMRAAESLSALATADQPSHARPAVAPGQADTVAPQSHANASASALAEWRQAVADVDGMLADYAALAVAVEPRGSEHWHVVFPAGATTPSEYCEQPARRSELQRVVACRLGRSIQLTFAALPLESSQQSAATPLAAVRAQRLREVSEHPLIKQIRELLDGEIVRVDPPRRLAVPESSTEKAGRTMA